MVQDYILYYRHEGVLYEIHLIDTPGFDDGVLTDANVLQRIADYVNTTYRLKRKLAGVLYLHDITKTKVGGVALRNLRMLEGLIGMEACDNCALITTKWGCSNDPQGEDAREKTLSEQEKFFGGMLRSNAKMKRFDPKTKAKALEIITPYLNRKFTLKISRQMADPRGLRLALGDTEAGKVVADNVENVEKLAQTKQQLARVHQAKELLAEKYDETLFEEFKQKRKVLRRRINMHRSGRWIIRIGIVGGAIVATVLTLGPGASAFMLEPAYEKVVRGQRKAEKKDKENLKAEFVKKSKNTRRLKHIDSDWLDDKDVKDLDDLESYRLKSESSDSDIMEVAQQGKVVGFAASEDSPFSAADLATSEDLELSESDDDSWGSDVEKAMIMA